MSFQVVQLLMIVFWDFENLLSLILAAADDDQLILIVIGTDGQRPYLCVVF